MIKPQKHRIIILPGWEQHKQHWQSAAVHLSDWDVDVIDLPGFGEEPLVSPDWGVPEYANWVETKITKMVSSGEKIVLLGHSFGGRIAGVIASHNPDWLDRLILYGAPCLYRPSSKVQRKIKLAKLLKKLRIKKRFNKNAELAAADENGMGQIFRKVVTYDQTEILGKIKTYVLLIWGENDPDVPLRIAKEMSELIPQNELVILDNLGHNAHLENPTLFYGTIKRYLENN